MGSCASVHKNSDSSMKLRLSLGSSKPDNLINIPPFPVKPNGNRPINDLPLKSHWSPAPSTTTSFQNNYGKVCVFVTNYPKCCRESLSDPSRMTSGSKEESFFDTRPWLDSDCEDDFYSVNGDFTPSRGNTPVHQSLSVGNNRTPFENRTPGSIPSPSPTDKKKKLLELFQESFRDGEDTDNEVKPTAPNLPPKSVNGSPVSGSNSVSGSERTANGDVLNENEKPFKSSQCCLPSLVSCRSSSRRKKMNPTIAVADKA